MSTRADTERSLVEAVGTVLAERGFLRFGVNEIARVAGVNKSLIYRYFGGLEGLVRAYAEGGDFVPALEELCDGDVEAMRALPPATRMRRVFLAYVDGLRRRPRTVEILAWEGVERNDLTAILEDQRERLSFEVMEQLGLRDPVAFVLATASAHHLLVRARHIRVYAGFELADRALWEAMADRLARLAEA